MKQQLFVQRYAEDWQRFQDLVKDLEAGEFIASGKRYLEFARLYRQICHLQSIAINRNYSRVLVDELNDLVLRGHRQLYRRRSRLFYSILNFFYQEFPQLVRREVKIVLVATTLFYLPAIILFLNVSHSPDLIYSVFEPGVVSDFESMYDPENKKLGEARNAETDVLMFGYYIRNNIGVAFHTFSTGLLLGIGSIFYLIYNGIVLGAVAAHLTKVGFTGTFFPFVIGHGSFELTAITLAGAAGLKLGYSLIAPGEYSRIDALRRASKVAIKLIYGVIVMLLIAAFIEAFWSANGLLPASYKYAVGIVLWILVIGYLTLFGRHYGTR